MIEERSLPDLVRDATSDAVTLIRQEGELFKREVELKAERIQGTLVLLVVGAVGAIVAGLSAAALATIVLAHFIPLWAASLVVTAALAVVAMVALSWAKRRVTHLEATPDTTVESVKKDVRALKGAVQ